MNILERKAPVRETEHDTEAIRQIGEQQHEQLKNSFENVEIDESQREQDATSAKLEALQNASRAEKQNDDPSRHHEASPAHRRGPISKKQLDTQFKRTMEQVRDELPASSKAFSKFIHLKPIERTSDALGATIARPNALLAGAICAFALTLGLYLFAKNMGYTLSGFETIGAFILGWLIGLLYDYLRVMVTGKKDT